MNHSEVTFEAVIFDMDGVVINSKEHVEAFWIKKLTEYDIEIPPDEREKRFHGRPARPTVNDLFADLPKDIREQIIREYEVYDASVENYPMLPGIDRFLKN